jgi:hypothetical protein
MCDKSFQISANSLTLLIMNSLMTQGDLKHEDLTSKLVCLNVDGAKTFQGFILGRTI